MTLYGSDCWQSDAAEQYILTQGLRLHRIKLYGLQTSDVYLSLLHPHVYSWYFAR